MKICGYTRISVDLEEDSRENTSIENQKKIISDFVAEQFPDGELCFYADRDRSGYTFEQRESYQVMRRALLSGEASILIVKDFSRFSRRNSLGLLELETLRDAKVRIISIGDNIDYPTKDDWMLIQFKFLMNEMPVTDTSKKIKQIIQNRQKNGQWVCAVPYGYRITNTKEMTYEIDPPAAEVVREVFRLYNNGWGYKKIANYLTDQGIPTPRANEIARKEAEGKATKLQSKCVWSIISVSGILSNDFYIGTLRQRKYSRRKINGADEALSAQDHIVLENAHAPIVDTRSFAYAQEQRRLRSRSNYRGEKKYATDYSGFLYCGDCGSPMFSMSRPDLAPAYTCGTYHRRGRKGCTSHHIRVDLLDQLLKRFVQRVKDNAQEMMSQLEEALRAQPQREEEIGQTIATVARQLDEAKEQLKALYKRKVLDTVGKSSEAAALVEETYGEIETELTQRITALEKQIRQNSDLRNEMLRTNRAAKTVLDVFQDILDKPRLDKRDISLLVERITVYEDHLTVKLKSDVDTLLALEDKEEPVNFPKDSKDISSIFQSSAHRRDKVFTVNVVSSGDPLEIFTNSDGGVVFKKYSLMGGLGDFSAQLCESLYKSTGKLVTITDRDACLAVAGGGKRELTDKNISPALAQIMEGRQIYQYEEGESQLPVSDYSDNYIITTAAPILAEGDVLGCVVFLSEKESVTVNESEYKLAQTIAGFLGRHMES